jgi:tetratricopeptide (TPR) repeat protein
MSTGRHDTVKAANRYHDRAIACHQQCEHRKARLLCLRALAFLEEGVGRNHPDVANVLNTLGQIVEEQGDYGAALELYGRSVRIMSRGRNGGADLVRIRVQSISRLAGLYRVQGCYRKAEPLYRQALLLAEKTLGCSDAEVASVCNNLAILYKYTGDFTKAARLYRRALAIAVRIHGCDSSGVATIYHNLGGLQHARGRFALGDPAVTCFTEAIEQNPNLAVAYSNRAIAFSGTGEHDKAIADCTQAIGIDSQYAPAYVNRGNAYQANGKYGNAIADFDEALRLDPEDALPYTGRLPISRK